MQLVVVVVVVVVVVYSLYAPVVGRDARAPQTKLSVSHRQPVYPTSSLGRSMCFSVLPFARFYRQISAVFLTRSFGCLLGALVSTHLYGKMRKNTVIYLSLQALMAVVASLPFITSEWTLHVTLLAAGFFASIVDTGCQIMTQRLYGAKAGHYLGANVLAYSVSGACVPVIAYVTDSFVAQYAVVAAMTGAIGVLIFLPPAPETLPGVMEVSTSNQLLGNAVETVST